MHSHDRRSGHRRGATCLAALAWVVVGCAIDDVRSSTTMVPPTVTRPAITQPATTVSATVATTVPTTSAATMPPSTTVPVTYAPGSAEAEVFEAMLEAWHRYNDVLADPFNDDKLRAAGQIYSGPLQQALVENVADYRSNDWKTTPNPEVPGTIQVYRGGVAVDVATGSASVTYCEVNPWIVVRTGAGSDGSDIVVDDDVSAQRYRMDFQLIDGTWRAVGGELLMNWPEATSCPDLP